MASKPKIRIGYVPEHYLTPLHLAVRLPQKDALPFDIEIRPFPSGTGHMITALRGNDIDIGIGLTEGWIAGLTGKQQVGEGTSAGSEGGYKVVGQWVETPLRWAIVTGRDRGDLKGVEDLKGKRAGVSRIGSGSHIMSFVLSQRQGWSPDDLEPVVLGPFPALRDGVSGSGSSANHAGDPEQTAHAAEFFMWEHFTTKPEFDDRTAEQAGRSHPTLKKIGEIFTPWPSWLIAASTTTFPQPDTDDRLSALFGLLDAGIAEFNAQPDRVVDLLASGAFGCQYTPDDAREWMETVRFVQGGTRGLSRDIVEQTVAVLKVAGVIPSDLPVDRAVELVTGISR